jgi:phosphate:Na+ symporter
MLHLLNLLAAIALLVWGTHIVRTGMLRVLGENLRRVLAMSFSNRLRGTLWPASGVTSIVQSSTATCLIVASFVGKGLVTTQRRARGDAGRRRRHRADGGGGSRSTCHGCRRC